MKGKAIFRRAWLLGFPAVLLATIPACPGSGTNGDGEGDGGPPVIRGRIAPDAARPVPASARKADMPDVAGCVVVAVSNETGAVYRGTVNADGTFRIEIPDSEDGHTFIQTILGSDGQPLGPILLSTAGATGLRPAGEANLGTITLPADLSTSPITAGIDADIDAGEVDSTAPVRLNASGVPVGVDSYGKGAASLISGGAANGPAADPDADGLVNLFDADRDGNGVVNDFEPGCDSWELPADSDVRAAFFTNLKIDMSRSGPYYGTDDAARDAAIARDTVITFEIVSEPWSTRTVTGARILPSPAPAYLTGATVLGEGTEPLWSASDYAITFNPQFGVFSVFIHPNAVMNCGDTFTAEVSFDDGSTEQYSRMIAYVLKNIPRLTAWGTAEALQPFDSGGASDTGVHGDPIRFDGNEDLVLVWKPPADETGSPLTHLDYHFEMKFYRTGIPAGGTFDQYQAAAVENLDIDAEATWPSAIPGFGNFFYFVPASDLTLSEDGTYSVTLPRELFVDEVVMKDGSTRSIGQYGVEIAAQCSSGNASISVLLIKQ